MELTGIRGTVLSFMVPELPGLDIAGPPAESYDAPVEVSGPLQSTAQTTPPDTSLPPSAVRCSQLCSRHHSLRAATYETSSALPHRSVVHGVTTVVFS